MTTTQQIPPEATFRQRWLQAISHLSAATRKAIIADVVEYQLTGIIPVKISKMRRALFNSFILEIAPDADISVPEPQDCMAEASESEIKIQETEARSRSVSERRPETRKKHSRMPSRIHKPEYATVEKSPYSEEAAVYGADVPEYFIYPDENMLGRFINDPVGYGYLVDNEVPEFTVPLSEVRSVVAEWIDRRRGFLDYRQFRDRLLRVFRGEQMQKYRKEHPVPVSVW